MNPPPPPPANDLCAGATPLTFLPNGSATAWGDTADALDDASTLCSSPQFPLTGPDRVYSFTLAAATQVTATVRRTMTDGGLRPSVSIRSSCLATDEVACLPDDDGEAAASVPLAAGTYYVFVDGRPPTRRASAPDRSS